MKINFSALLLFVCAITTNLLYGQIPVQEPTDFDWKLGFTQETITSYSYDPAVIEQMPEDAQFWVDVQQSTSKMYLTNFAKDGVNIYERYTSIESTKNGEDFNHGLSDMIKTESTVYLSTLFDPEDYYQSPNAETYEYGIPVKDPRGVHIDFGRLLEIYENSDLINVTREGNNWFRDPDQGVEISINPNKQMIVTYYMDDQMTIARKFAQVNDGIQKVVMEVVTRPSKTIEGYCIEERIVSVNKNFEFEFHTEFQNEDESSTREHVEFQNEVNVLYEEGQITFDFEENVDSELSISIFDVSGRLVQREILQGDNYIQFYPSMTGIYLVEIAGQSFHSIEKVFIK